MAAFADFASASSRVSLSIFSVHPFFIGMPPLNFGNYPALLPVFGYF
jgi:hypothetical protein